MSPFRAALKIRLPADRDDPETGSTAAATVASFFLDHNVVVFFLRTKFCTSATATSKNAQTAVLGLANDKDINPTARQAVVMP